MFSYRRLTDYLLSPRCKRKFRIPTTIPFSRLALYQKSAINLGSQSKSRPIFAIPKPVPYENHTMSSERPKTLLLSLAFRYFFDEHYSPLIDSLDCDVEIKRAKKPDASIRYLEANIPNVIIITDEGLSMHKSDVILNKIKS